MADRRDSPVLEGRVDGVRGGLRLHGATTVHLLDDAVLLEGGFGVVTIEHDCLEGVVATPEGVVLLHCAGGDRVSLVVTEGEPRGAPLASALELAATRLPELARSLRTLGSRRGLPGSDHDRFFRPFLLARQRLEEGRTLEERLQGADAIALRMEIERVAAAFARERHPQSAPDRRALHAELEDLAEPLLDALERLDARADAVRSAEDVVRIARWRRWSAALADVFLRADDWWAGALPALADSRGRDGRLWRRILRKG